MFVSQLISVSWRDYSHRTCVASWSELRSDGWMSRDLQSEGRKSGHCRLWGGLDKARHIAPTAILVRVHCFIKGLYKAVWGPNTRLIVLSIINLSYCRRLRRLTFFPTRRDEIRCAFDPPWFVLQQTGWKIIFYTYYWNVISLNFDRSENVNWGYDKQNRNTERCSKLKRSVDMTSSGKNGLNIKTNASPKWDRTRCPEE